AAAAVLLLALLLMTNRRRDLWLGGALGVLMLAGVAISLSRGAWLGLLAGAALVGLARWGALLRRGFPVAVAVGLIVPGALLLAVPAGQQPALSGLADRLASLGSLEESGTVRER